MDKNKFEVKTIQELADHLQAQLDDLRQESRDGDLQILWSMNLFLIQMIEALHAQLGFIMDFGYTMESCSEYVSSNFEALKGEEGKFQDFVSLVKSVDEQKEGESGSFEEQMPS